MTYEIGQAVMITFSFENKMLFIYQENKDPYVKCSGLINPNDSETVLIESTRPATQSEILEHIQQHEWETKDKTVFDSPSAFWRISLSKVWKAFNCTNPSDNNLKEYCEEGLIADRIIKALNLAK